MTPMFWSAMARKALFLRNNGDEKFLDLRVERILMDKNPATRDQGTDSPGRGFVHALIHIAAVAWRGPTGTNFKNTALPRT
jgi:Bacterial archaeo-eukaryotic release factor family 12